jgi:hypothetical protein
MRLLTVLPAAIAILGSCLSAGSVSAQDFSPAELADMVKSAYSGCMRSQLQNPNNAGASRDLIEKYCACTANKTASRSTRSDVAKYEANKGLASEELISRAHEIGIECRAELAR